MTTEADPRIDGVGWSRVSGHPDQRGSFRELWRAGAYGALPEEQAGRRDATFVQANLSRSSAQVLRGMHCHQRQLDHWIVLRGRVFVALVDIRAVVARRSTATVVTRVMERDDTVTIPVGVAHGFLALEPVELLYLVTNEYDLTDELAFAWDDPALAIPWPAMPGGPVLSERDRANPSLADLIRDLGMDALRS